MISSMALWLEKNPERYLATWQIVEIRWKWTGACVTKSIGTFCLNSKWNETDCKNTCITLNLYKIRFMRTEGNGIRWEAKIIGKLEIMLSTLLSYSFNLCGEGAVLAVIVETTGINRSSILCQWDCKNRFRAWNKQLKIFFGNLKRPRRKLLFCVICCSGLAISGLFVNALSHNISSGFELYAQSKACQFLFLHGMVILPFLMFNEYLYCVSQN